MDRGEREREGWVGGCGGVTAAPCIDGSRGEGYGCDGGASWCIVEKREKGGDVCGCDGGALVERRWIEGRGRERGVCVWEVGVGGR